VLVVPPGPLNSWPSLSAAGNPTSGLVDKNGAAMTVLNNNTWGITYDMCEQYCNWSAIPLVIILRFVEAWKQNLLITYSRTSSTLTAFPVQ
jgi:hypothetical protein